MIWPCYRFAGEGDTKANEASVCDEGETKSPLERDRTPSVAAIVGKTRKQEPEEKNPHNNWTFEMSSDFHN